jgi:hypothetical protein
MNPVPRQPLLPIFRRPLRRSKVNPPRRFETLGGRVTTMRGLGFARLLSEMRAMQAARYGLSLDDLAEEYRVSTRTVRRDLMVLQEAGVPVTHIDEGGQKRYRVLNGRAVA